MEQIDTNSAPGAIGPYSQAIKSGSWLFCSGQIPLDPKTGALVSEDVAEQTHQVLKNLSAVLAAAGSSLNELVKTTIFLKSMADFTKVNEVYASYLTAPFPARATVEVSRLPKDVLVEIDGIAICKG